MLRVLRVLDGGVQVLPYVLHPTDRRPCTRRKRLLHHGYLLLPLMLLMPPRQHGRFVAARRASGGGSGNDAQRVHERVVVAGAGAGVGAGDGAARFHESVCPVMESPCARFRHQRKLASVDRNWRRRHGYRGGLLEHSAQRMRWAVRLRLPHLMRGLPRCGTVPHNGGGACGRCSNQALACCDGRAIGHVREMGPPWRIAVG